MKYLYVAVVALAFYFLGTSQCQAVTKCAPDGKGGICCWDVDQEGPWKPISC